MPRRSCLQVLYEFHLSAAWGTIWRISPNGLVCNCSVNTCLSRLGECGGKKVPHSNALKPLIEQPIAIYFWMVAGSKGPSQAGGTPWLNPYSPDFIAARLLWNDLHSEVYAPWAGKQTQWHRKRWGGLCLCGLGCSLQAPGLCRSWLCV